MRPSRPRRFALAIRCALGGAALALDSAASIQPALVYSTYLGGSQDEPEARVTCRVTGDLALAGRTHSDDIPVTLGGATSDEYDLWIAVLEPSSMLPSTEQLIWSRLHGGSKQEFAGAVGVDADGNVYLTGWTESSDFPTTDGSSGPGIFALSVAADGSVVRYSIVLGEGGSGQFEDGGLAVAPDGSAWLTGTTADETFPVTLGPEHAGGTDVVVAALDASGELLWSRFVGGAGDDSGRGLAVGGNGRIRITGQTESSGFPVPGGFQTELAGISDAFLVELDAAGAITYGTFLGGVEGNGPGDREKGLDLAVDSEGHVWMTGRAGSADFPVTAGAFSADSRPNDAFLTVIDPAAKGAESLLYSTLLGGSDSERGVAVVVDAHRRGVVLGRTLSDDLPVTPDALAPSALGQHDLFLAVLAPSQPGAAGLHHLTYFGGTRDDTPGGLARSEEGGLVVYLAGDTEGWGFPVTDGSFSEVMAGGSNDSFVTALVGLDRVIFRDGFESGDTVAWS